MPEHFGRPKGPKKIQLNIWISPESKEALLRLAEAEGRKQNQLIEMMILERARKIKEGES